MSLGSNRIERLREAVALLFSGPHRFAELNEIIADARRLEGHPFGLPVEGQGRRLVDSLPQAQDTVYLLGELDATDSSVDAMTRVIGFMLGAYTSDARPMIRYVRIITAGTKRVFEIGSRHGCFIVGGCDLLSEEGVAGGRQLRVLFDFARGLYGVDFVEVEIEADKAREGLARLHSAYSPFDWSMTA